MGDIVCETRFCYCNIAKAFTKSADSPAQTMAEGIVTVNTNVLLSLIFYCKNVCPYNKENL